MVDPDILLISFVDTIEGVKSLIGERGAGAVLREAGRHSGPKLLESLIGQLPEVLDTDRALERTLSILRELGFAEELTKNGKEIIVKNDVFTEAIRGEVNTSSPVVLFLAGLIEGFVQFMSGERVSLKATEARKGFLRYTLC
ncbi:MAG: hypothetical protein GXO04_04525 [Aquificae bacterium]|nr:hypothetical protein [Aquificota bacterium]